ncbi:MAG: hypothetical protein ACW97Z_12160 [Candidatus Hodarchaeales archaeon]
MQDTTDSNHPKVGLYLFIGSQICLLLTVFTYLYADIPPKRSIFMEIPSIIIPSSASHPLRSLTIPMMALSIASFILALYKMRQISQVK